MAGERKRHSRTTPQDQGQYTAFTKTIVPEAKSCLTSYKRAGSTPYIFMLCVQNTLTTYNAKQRSGRSESSTRKRSTGWQGTSQRHRSGSSSDSSQVINAELCTLYEDQLDAVENAYPNVKVWRQSEGMWLFTESSLLEGLEKKAAFLTAIPFTYHIPVRSWGFWTSPVFKQWIGPRHTNFPDGSICAFEPRDKTWLTGGDIVKLLDLYSLWALRHLYFELFGRWPGRQSIYHPFERLTELKDNEFCGCEKSNLFYADCCKKQDLERNQIADIFDFWRKYGKVRQPPTIVKDFVWTLSSPPPIREIL